MKKLIMITAAIIIVCAAVNCVIVNASSYDESIPTGNRIYIIREYDGKVACFEQDSEKPFLITETLIRDLPPIDRMMLTDGVEVIGAKSLSRALEDYRS